MVEGVLVYLSIMIVISAIIVVIARIIRQPPIIAYLISGVIMGPLVLGLIGPSNASSEMMQTFARIGVAFLLFIVGLNLDFRLLKEIGKVSAITGIFEMLLVGVVGFLVAIWIGFSSIAALYIAAALAFSSTVVVVKILSDKKEMDTLHGRIALGILIIQDIAASLGLMIIPLFNSQVGFNTILIDLGMAILVIGLVFIISGLFFNRFLSYLAKNQETLFIFGIAWALALAAIFSSLGFSIEIGALIAGMSLASSKYALDIGGKMKPLRDFFVVLFFIFFGSQLTGPITLGVITSAIIFSLLVMIIKPLTVVSALRFFGYTKRTNFLTSLSLAQVSEFSLILVMLGFTLGHVGKELMNITILVALITLGLSTYGLHASQYLSKKLAILINLFEGKTKEEKFVKEKSYDTVLFGYHRIGYKLLETIKKIDGSFLVIDYNPKTVLALEEQGIDAIFGDASNKEFLNEINIDKAKLIVSTIPDENSNLTIREMLKEKKSKAVFMASAEDPRIALELYQAGIDFVIIPHHLGGDYAANLINEFKTSKQKYYHLGKQHKKDLEGAKKSSIYPN